MSVDNVQINSAVGVDGNSYTTAISNDQLTNNDFLRLLLEEMKQQDPTKPMDSKEMMNSQLQMSTIKANQKMTEAMISLQQSYANSTLATSANLIGHTVEDGSINDKGYNNSYKIGSVESKDNDIFLIGYAITGLDDEGNAIYSTEKTYINMKNVTKIN